MSAAAILREPGPTLGTLARVELRKTVDTRAGRWLLSIVALLIVAIPVIYGLTGPDGEKSLGEHFQVVQLPTGVLLPVLGILLVTSEWSQRTALTTFTLMPRRPRVIVAKVLAVVALTAAALVLSFPAAALGVLASGTDGTWSIGGDVVGEIAVMQLAGFLGGFAFGLAFQASAPAIVLYFVLPTIVSILTQVVPGIDDAMRWVDLGQATIPFGEGDVTGTEWGRFGTSVLAWVGLPLAIGLARLRRGELK